MSGYFLRLIEHLRHYEEVILYGGALKVPSSEQQEVIDYLEAEYAIESIDYPYLAPPFQSPAALWAAHTLYTAAQLLLYREHKASDLETLLPPFNGERTAAAVLSADLTLRFFPDIIGQLKAIDPEDRLIVVLEAHLTQWHYSGVACSLALEQLDFTAVTANPCLLQLYANRVIELKKAMLARHPALAGTVGASLGGYAREYWPDLTSELIPN